MESGLTQTYEQLVFFANVSTSRLDNKSMKYKVRQHGSKNCRIFSIRNASKKRFWLDSCCGDWKTLTWGVQQDTFGLVEAAYPSKRVIRKFSSTDSLLQSYHIITLSTCHNTKTVKEQMKCSTIAEWWSCTSPTWYQYCPRRLALELNLWYAWSYLPL